MKLVIDDTRCKGCNLCVMVCPYNIFREGQRPNKRGVFVPELDRPGRCTNCRLQQLYQRRLCGVCQTICPDQAIRWVQEAPFEPHKVVIEY
ncbi:4Fe-4S dicluster domain-containing protein [Methanocalculus sp.]|uniref:4Fe-4S dicluster domain-containing protein n=1 Tax=Methanocalculus sp. TaxID=2004547 RepID=UPI0026185A79|nr:4Fe-4S dicluster domain-containing protein [Methanocalculus sp.]MDG6251784.1 4Fe-4S dicluster domain-containing protein [Methanocalculus sp.]